MLLASPSFGLPAADSGTGEGANRGSRLAQKKEAAEAQFDRAERMRAALQDRPPAQRTVEMYKRVVDAYHRVYLITPQAPEVTAALVAMAELYQEMGRQFDLLYFHAAVETNQFLLHEYPATRRREEVFLSIARIQREDLNETDAAEETYRDFLRLFPASPRAGQARQALADIAAAREASVRSAERDQAEELPGRNRDVPRVTAIRRWNADSYTRIVIDLEGPVNYQSARIPDPDRIYFDLYKARLNPGLSGKTLEVGDGFLKAIRVAQNQEGVVRVVLDLDRVRDYSAFILTHPYRMVIDVRGEAPATTTAGISKPPISSELDTATVEGKATEAKLEKADATVPAPALATKRQPAAGARAATAVLGPAPAPLPTRAGERSLTRALGLKIGRIVIDAGHGGHDTGTIGPAGLMEKDLCLDVALRLGKLIQSRMPGAEVVYTRADDTFIPLENRTAIANQEHADLFVSIHANSSHDHSARGIETYYLNFATSPEAQEVAARENALSQSSMHELQDLIRKIARNDKIEESRELALDLEDSLVNQLQRTHNGTKDRGVKKAPFVVLIGANMPSVLAEISFLSNPNDERLLKKPDQRQRVALGLFNGIEKYLASLNSVSYNQGKTSPQAAVHTPQ